LDPFPGQSVNDIQNYLYEESLKLEPRNCRQPLKFVSFPLDFPRVSRILIIFSLRQPRKWPELTLKSPGIKPGRRQNNSNASLSLSNTLPFSGKHQLLSTSEGEQSPPANLSSSEFSVFANVNIGSGNASGEFGVF
jgi:son of sevenless-like protein